MRSDETSGGEPPRAGFTVFSHTRQFAPRRCGCVDLEEFFVGRGAPVG